MNVVALQAFRNLKLEKEFQSNYEALLESLSLIEIQAEVESLTSLFSKTKGIKKNSFVKGKLILEELSKRSTKELKSQIQPLILKLSKEFKHLPS